MKKTGLKLALLMLICVATGLVQSCGKEEDWQKVRHIDRIEIMNNNQVTSYYVFSYDGDKMSLIEEYMNYKLQSSVEFQYKDSKMASWNYYFYYNDSLFAKITTMFEYKDNNIIRAISKKIDEKGGNNDTVEYKYSDNKLKEIHRNWQGGIGTFDFEKLVWDGNNISRVLFPNHSRNNDYTIYLDYDNNKNPIRFPMGFVQPDYYPFFGDQNYPFLSENNITRINWVDTLYSEFFVGYEPGYHEYIYTYDEEGYPLTRTEKKYNRKWVYHYSTE